MPNASRQDTKDREADFHNTRLSGNEDHNRVEQSKYYWVTDTWNTRFWETIERHSRGKRVLEIGCFSGERTIKIASVAAKVYAIDISSAAVEITSARARALGLLNVEVAVGDAETLQFEDGTLDVVFCAGVIHHVNVNTTLREIYRVLAPAGRAIFREPLAHNPLLAIYRRLTPNARTADEHPLRTADLRAMSRVFDGASFDYFGMLALVATPLRGTRFGKLFRSALVSLDNLLFNNFLLGRYCWQVNIVLNKRR